MKVTLYTIPGCSQCKALDGILNNKKIEHMTIENEEIMRSKGFVSAPQLEVVMNMKEAMEWLKDRNGENR